MIWNKIVDLLFPRRCPVCDDIVKGFERTICIACEKVPCIIKEPKCRKCGKQLKEEEKEYCKDCTGKTYYYKEGAAVFLYGSMKQSLYRFKYGERQEYAKYYAEQIEQHLGEKIKEWNPDAIIPVPLHTARKRKRGYNQAEVLAKEVGKRLNLPVNNKIIFRLKNTVPQKGLGNRERQNNLKRAFKIFENDVKLSTIIIIDDIYTTGSTVDALAKEFLRVGVKNIYVIALACGEEQ